MKQGHPVNITIKTKYFPSIITGMDFDEAIKYTLWSGVTPPSLIVLYSPVFLLAYGSLQTRRRRKVCQSHRLLMTTKNQCFWDIAVHLHIWIHSNWGSMHKTSTGLSLIKFHPEEKRWAWSPTPWLKNNWQLKAICWRKASFLKVWLSVGWPPSNEVHTSKNI